MEKTTYLPNTPVKLEALLAKWETGITVLVALCAVVAILLGIVWLFLRKDTLLFTTLGFSFCYLIGRNFWRFRPPRPFVENKRLEIEGGLG
jgi:ABC-type branched-subunit amino acid transport system permease subunit